jgi:bifunctional non-homologous end joining protein LigD
MSPSLFSAMCEVRAHPVRKRGPALAVTSPFRFIQPCSPVLAKTVPTGDDWQHEIKFDGFRVQIHKLGREVEV